MNTTQNALDANLARSAAIHVKLEELQQLAEYWSREVYYRTTHYWGQ